MGEVARQVEPEELTEEAWAPFGWLPVDDTDPRDGTRRLEFAWDDVHLNVIGHSLDEVPRLPEGLRCDMMFRHATHTQALMVLNCEAVIAVAPSTATFESPADVDAARAF